MDFPLVLDVKINFFPTLMDDTSNQKKSHTPFHVVIRYNNNVET